MKAYTKYRESIFEGHSNNEAGNCGGGDRKKKNPAELAGLFFSISSEFLNGFDMFLSFLYSLQIEWNHFVMSIG
jgi:hypothetical protein